MSRKVVKYALMEIEYPRFRKTNEGPSTETLAARRLAQELREQLDLFRKSTRMEMIFPLLVTEYNYIEDEPYIPFSDYSIVADITPIVLEDEIRCSIDRDLARHPRPISYTDRTILPELPFNLTLNLQKRIGEAVVQSNTIFPLMSKSTYLEQIRRIQILSIGEIWIAERWIHEKLADELFEQAKRS